MLSFLVIASLILPSVMGGCCLPNRLSAVLFRAGGLNSYEFLMDFSMKRFFVKPSSGDIQYVYGNMTDGNDYVRYKDGTCTFAPTIFPLRSCIPDTATDAGFATIGEATVKPYIMTAGGRRLTVVVTPHNCHPVMYMQTIDGKTTTVLYTNISTTVTDVSVFNTKVNDCEPQSIID